jgi:hypothetical protein
MAIITARPVNNNGQALTAVSDRRYESPAAPSHNVAKTLEALIPVSHKPTVMTIIADTRARSEERRAVFAYMERPSSFDPSTTLRAGFAQATLRTSGVMLRILQAEFL